MPLSEPHYSRVGVCRFKNFFSQEWLFFLPLKLYDTPRGSLWQAGGVRVGTDPVNWAGGGGGGHGRCYFRGSEDEQQGGAMAKAVVCPQ